MADINHAFNVEQGISLSDKVGIFEGDADPSVTGEAAPVGSLYLRTDGTIWSKIGPLDTDWLHNLPAGGVINHAELQGLANDDHPQYYNQTRGDARYSLTTHTHALTLSGDATGSGSVAGTVNLTLANTGVTAGTYNNSATSVRPFSVDAKGRITSIGTAVTITPAWASITGKPTTLAGYGITDAATSTHNHTLDSLSNVTISAKATNDLLRWNGTAWINFQPTYISSNQNITISGDASGAGSTAIALTLANSGVTAGTYTKLTVDAKGRATAGSLLLATDIPNLDWSKITTGKPTTLSGYGITDGVNSSLIGANNGLATLDANGKLSVSQLPNLAISETSVVSSQSAMLALIAQTGDIAIRTDLSKTFILKGSDPAILSNWEELLSPTGGVTSINGQTGAVSLTTITGNAGTATALQTARTISLSSDVTGSVLFDGTNNANIVATLSSTGVAAGTYGRVTVDAKGRVTSASEDALDNLSDVVISSPTLGQVLQYNGTNWINNGTAQASAAAGILNSWTLISGNRYYADFAHNLNTTNVVISLYDNSTNQIVHADSLVLTNANTVRVSINGNTAVLRIVVIANGMAVGMMNLGGSPGILQDLIANRPAPSIPGRLFLSTDSKVLFRDTGSSWDIIVASSGVVKSYSYVANSLDSPTTSDFAIAALAPTIADSANTGLNVRSFSNTTEQGVAFTLNVPLGASTITFRTRGRAQTAPGSVAVVQPRIYTRNIPHNAVVPAWSAATDLTAIGIPTNTFYQSSSQSLPLSTFGMVVGGTYQVEFTRKVTGVTGGTNLASAWLLLELVVEFT